ncbi:DNA polymerase [Siphonobacter sp. SORGH_AS_1065]|uniref:DNA polymerase n=1 Tax=Siphonobacter sp. SORGH_AS_1065 TaxID=3041795 RepID=UPI002789364C|nr:DNA polymerase [Siphonobacter sp. SORGH_AS_1065]MDQ1088597.1 DNA polymerase I-like protein with 3'-5' exonuclease and polymerase domains [Siphonobacter sp. SORGH_AS_1065]
MILSIDIETYSSVNLLKTGVYPYIASPDFQILMLAYSIDGGPVGVIDMTCKPLHKWLIASLTNPNHIKTAWNAAFERLCLSKHLGIELPVEQWDCTMVRAARAGYPLQLGQAAKAMGLDQEKDTAGKALIKYFSVPCTPTKKNGGRTRNMPSDDPEKWAQYIEYNRQDVVVEMAIRDRVIDIPVTEFEQRLYCLDQKINDTGILVDVNLATNAIQIQESYVSQITQEAISITGLDNPNSVKQLSSWLNENGQEVEKLRKEDVSEMLSSKELAAEVRRILQIRQEASKSSVKKYEAMLAYIGADNRVRGLFQFYGANRTGRWAGRGIQLQNLPQNHLDHIELAREVVKENDEELLHMLWKSVPDTLSQLIRTALIPKEGHVLIISDFSAIEARVIAWLAGEQWRLDVFATHGKIYEASASKMFNVPIEQITKGSDLRQKR